MKPGRPRRGESVPSAKVKTWLDPACLEHVQRRGGSCYVRQLILTDLPTRKEPVSEQATRPGKSKFEVVIPAELKPMVMEAGGSAYVRHLVENETERRTMNEHEMNLDAIAKCIEAQSSLPQTVSLQETDTHPDYSESGDLCLVRVAVDTEEFFENRYLKGTILSVDRQDLLGLHHHDPRLLNIFKHIKKPTHNQIAAARSDLGLPDPEGMRPFHLDFQEHTLNRISTYTPPEETIDEYKARTSHLPKLEMIDPDTISENFERYKSQRDGYCKQRTDETITELNQLREETHRILGAL